MAIPFPKQKKEIAKKLSLEYLYNRIRKLLSMKPEHEKIIATKILIKVAMDCREEIIRNLFPNPLMFWKKPYGVVSVEQLCERSKRFRKLLEFSPELKDFIQAQIKNCWVELTGDPDILKELEDEL